MKALIIAATIAVVCSPAPAWADGFVSPWIGTNFASEPSDGRRALGLTAGSMGGGVIGGEVDFGYSPSFFGEETVFGSNNVLNLMGNVIIGVPIGGQAGVGVRPYVTGGVGLIRSKIGSFLGEGASNNDIGFNLGGGVMGFFADHIGVRGDLRFFRTVNSDLIDADFDPEFSLGDFDFWRMSFGVVFR
jgi:opacity protein-like surface antigen